MTMVHVYAIVLFLPRKLSDNIIDLVPSSWIKKDPKSDVSHCKYPARKDYPKLSRWIANLKEPEEAWEYFDVEIIAHARKYLNMYYFPDANIWCTNINNLIVGNLKQGNRRLKRALVTMKIRSTTDHSEDTILSENDILKELDKVLPFQDSFQENTFAQSDPLNLEAEGEEEENPARRGTFLFVRASAQERPFVYQFTDFFISKFVPK